MTSPCSLESDVLERLRSIAPESFLDELAAAHQPGSRKRLYPLSTVISLMILQRLQAPGTLASTVQHFAATQFGPSTRTANSPQQAAQRPFVTQKPTPPQQDRNRPISTDTGGYCKARQRMPTLVASKVNDHIFDQLWSQVQADATEPTFIIDGSTLQLQHEPDLVDKFPPGKNQHGENHWPMLLLVAFHDTRSGLAMRPAWGAKYGPEPASETGLAAQALDRLPPEALVLADSNFGIFAFAQVVQQSGRRMLLRLTLSRAGAITRQLLPAVGTHRKIVWQASRWDRKKNPELPPDAKLEGWIVAARNPSRHSEKLYFFTTVDPAATDTLSLYKRRWNIETDLRALKRTVHLHQIQARSVEMAEKELLMAVSAYNLVRAIQFLAAERAGIAPRELSFAIIQAAVTATLPYFHRAASPEELQERIELLLYNASRARLPKRQRMRSYPRRVWGRGGRFPTHSRKPASDPEQRG